MLLDRPTLLNDVRRALRRSRTAVLVGPRQSGKSTLAAALVPREAAWWFDLENPADRARLAQPASTLEPLLEARRTVVIDEVQLAPELFPLLRVLIDRSPRNGQFLLLGSASPALLRQAGESLLGRVEVVEVGGFDLAEVGVSSPARQTRLWQRGAYPRAFLAASDGDSFVWRQQAVARHVETDLPQFGVAVAAPAMLRFWTMLAHVSGQIWNAAPMARSLGLSEPTVRRHLDTLTQTFMLRQLQPWFANTAKRQVKAPKVYFRDSGLLHALLGIRSLPELLAHPVCGSSWEGFAVEQVLRIARPDQAYFWATHQGAELDLLLLKGQRRIGVEVRRADAPVMTRSMQIALADLALDALYVVYPGAHRYPIGPRVEAVPLGALMAA